MFEPGACLFMLFLHSKDRIRRIRQQFLGIVGPVLRGAAAATLTTSEAGAAARDSASLRVLGVALARPVLLEHVRVKDGDVRFFQAAGKALPRSICKWITGISGFVFGAQDHWNNWIGLQVQTVFSQPTCLFK